MPGKVGRRICMLVETYACIPHAKGIIGDSTKFSACQGWWERPEEFIGRGEGERIIALELW